MQSLRDQAPLSEVRSQELLAQDPGASFGSVGTGVSAESAVDDGLPRLASVTSTFESASLESASFETASIAQSDVDGASDRSFYEPFGTSSAENDYAYAPVNEAQPIPTLASLTETMPVREASPLVDSFRSSDAFRPATESSLLMDAPAAGSELEAFDSSSEQPSYAFESDLLESALSKPPSLSADAFDDGASFEEAADFSADLDLSADSDFNEAYSPLLQGLIDSTVEPTVYVPIATENALSSSVLLQDTVDTLNALNGDISTASFLSELAARDAFSSVLASEAFTQNEPMITLTSLRSNADEKGRTKRSKLKASYRSESVTLAAKQVSQRRQRLVWM